MNNKESTSIVIDCEVCHRTIWAGTRCLHGQVPPPKQEPQCVGGPWVETKPKKPLRGGLK